MERVVEKALESISDRINLDTGLTHPGDKSCTIELLRMLKNNGCQLVPSEIYSWSINHGWKDKYGLVLKKYVEEINAGTKHRIETGHWKDSIIEQFKRIE